jgi:hypothetical protein
LSKCWQTTSNSDRQAKKSHLTVAFLHRQRITAWLARRQQVRPLGRRQVQKLQQRVQEQQRVQRQEQELLLFYRKLPRQQQRSRLPVREICSFLKTKVS